MDTRPTHDQSNWDQYHAQLSLAEIQQQLPYVSIEPESVLTLKDGSLSAGLQYFPPHLDLLSNSDLNAMKRALANVVNTLDDGFTVQFDLVSSADIADITEKHFKKDYQIDPKIDGAETFEIERKYREKYYQNRQREGTLRSWKNFCYLNYHEPRSSWTDPKKLLADIGKSFLKGLSGKNIVQEEKAAYFDRGRKLEIAIETVQNTLAGLNWHPKILDPIDWCEEVFSLMNPRLHDLGYSPGYPTEDDRDFVNCVVWSQLREYDEGGGFELDGYHHRIMSLPEIKAGSTVFGILRILTNSNIPNMRISLIGKPAEPTHYLSEIRKDIRGLRDELNRNPDNQEVVKAITDRLEEQRQLLQGNQKVFESRIFVHIWERSRSVVEDRIAKFAKVGQEMGGAKWLEESYNATPYFFSSVPGWTNDEDTYRLNEFKSSTFVDLIPAFGLFDISAGIDARAEGLHAPVLMENFERGLCGWNPQDNTRGINLNGTVVGRIRSGKSVSATTINAAMLVMNPRIICIDLGFSSQIFTELCGGVYYTILDDRAGTASEGVKCINPFGGYGLKGTPTEDEILDISYVIETMLVDPTSPALDRGSRATLQKAIQETFRRNPNKEIFVRDLHAELTQQRANAEARSMANILSQWCGRGPYAKFVDNPSTTDLDNPIVGFELSGIDKRQELLPVIMAIILNHASRTAANYPGVPKIIWVDEFAVLGKNPVLARYIEIAYRTYGKTGTGVWTIAQQLGDYELCSPNGHVDAFLNNVGQQLFFAQEESAIEAIRRYTTLSASALARITHLSTMRGEYAEAVLAVKQQGGDPLVGSVIFRTNPIQYWIASTSANDRYVRDAYTQRFQRVEANLARARQRAILTLAMEMPRGFDAAGLGEMSPRLIETMRELQPGDDAPWSPYATPLARELGLHLTGPAIANTGMDIFEQEARYQYEQARRKK
jgi:type IV secretory pathway VirB4 component